MAKASTDLGLYGTTKQGGLGRTLYSNTVNARVQGAVVSYPAVH